MYLIELYVNSTTKNSETNRDFYESVSLVINQFDCTTSICMSETGCRFTTASVICFVCQSLT
jgi:hypothetical protein